jgi:hypothetical protein
MSDRTPADELARARSAAHAMSDQQLKELHAQGSSAFAAGAWEVLDQEVQERKRKRRIEVITRDGDEERYPALRVHVMMLKVAAVLIGLITFLGGATVILDPRPGAGFVVGIVLLIVGVVGVISYWAAAELFVLLMDIEQNTRSAARRE